MENLVDISFALMLACFPIVMLIIVVAMVLQ